MKDYIKGIIRDIFTALAGASFLTLIDIMGHILGFLTILLGFILACVRTYRYLRHNKQKEVKNECTTSNH